MTKDEALDQLRAEKTALLEALRRKDEELEQAQQAKQDLREGLKQAIIAIGSQQERVKVLEGLIDALQERIKTLERLQAKDSLNSSLPPSSCHGMSIGLKGAIYAARALAWIGLDVLTDAELRRAARAGFERRTREHPYVSPLSPEMKVPLGLTR